MENYFLIGSLITALRRLRKLIARNTEVMYQKHGMVKFLATNSIRSTRKLAAYFRL